MAKTSVYGVGLSFMLLGLVGSQFNTAASDGNVTALFIIYVAALTTGLGILGVALFLDVLGLVAPKAKQIMNAFK